ncbi:MAG: glycoside hydrolase family 30 beta sandwich domain-containing protein [Candidatus Acidiferrum sp.]
MRPRSLLSLPLIATAIFLAAAPPTTSRETPEVQLWLTTYDKTAVFAEQSPIPFSKPSTSSTTITLDATKTFQPIDGFGFALTGGSAQHLAQMDAAKRAALLRELFAADANNIGISYLRISIGASDLNDHVYSYDDVPSGETDPHLSKFTLAEDRIDLLPVLKEILAINPHIQILGSPWSAPAWMKTNDNVKGGELKHEYYEAYANYFVKYIQGMRAEGVAISAITPQNEPLNPKNTPSMIMQAPDEAGFIKNNLGPAFQAAFIKTAIIVYDHNCDVPEYATSILQDPAAYAYVDGSGFHLYGGEITAMSKVHDAFPQRNLYFTEFMAVEPTEPDRITITKPVVGTFIGALQNWSRNVLLWNLAANSKFEPHTDNGGCPICQGAVTIDGNDVTRNLAYYAMAHFSKFVRPGSIRIASATSPNSRDTLPNVAFKTPDHKIVLIVANDSTSSQSFQGRDHARSFVTELQPGSVATYIWPSK